MFSVDWQMIKAVSSKQPFVFVIFYLDILKILEDG